jgi:hypothetical protein
MKRIQLVLAALALVVTSLAAFAGPAMADDWGRNHDDHNDGFFFFGGNDIGDFDQDADSGDVDQSFDVSGTGENSNQTVGAQGVANTGNAQNQIGLTQFDESLGEGFGDFDRDHRDLFFLRDFDGFDDGFKFGDVGSSIEVSPTNTTSSDQEVNQAASAFGS